MIKGREDEPIGDRDLREETSMAQKNTLSVYLIKEDIIDDREIINHFGRYPRKSIPKAGTVYYDTSSTIQPKWVSSFFLNSIDKDELFTANARAVLLSRISTKEGSQRIFAVTMGYGKYMLKDDVIEERFGLKVILNSIDDDSIRRITKANVAGNQKRSQDQLPRESNIREFGFDIERDLVRKIAAKGREVDLLSGMMEGSDLFSTTVAVDITNITPFLEMLFARYKSQTYKSNFAWIDHIQEIRNGSLIEKLNEHMIHVINSGSDDFQLAEPEIIDWSEIRGFKYYRNQVLPELDLMILLDSFYKPLTSIHQFERKRIEAIRSEDNSPRFAWNAKKCLFGEMSIDGQAYCISEGKWYRVDSDFVQDINRDYEQTPVSAIDFDDYTSEHKNEADYNESFCERYPENYALLDRKTIPHGGGRSKVELCDLLSRKRELIHIKRYGASSTLSHLFNQGLVSAELLVSDQSFLRKANKTIREWANEDYAIEKPRNLKVVFGIISKYDGSPPHLPFFSKIAFSHVKSRIQAMGLSVGIQGIKDKSNVNHLP